MFLSRGYSLTGMLAILKCATVDASIAPDRIMIPGIDGSEQNAINRLYWVELRCKLTGQGYRIPRDRLRILGSSL